MEEVTTGPDGSQSGGDPFTDLLDGLLEDDSSEGTGDMGDLLEGLLGTEGTWASLHRTQGMSRERR
jgi:hypothetical protein